MHRVEGRHSVLNGTVLLRDTCQPMRVKDKKSKKQRVKAALASVTKEMAEPRFAESARGEMANQGAIKHGLFAYGERNNS